MKEAVNAMFLRLISFLILSKGLIKVADKAYQNSGNGKNSLSNGWKIAIIVALAALVISPIDLIPGDAATVVGLADDVAYLVGIIGTITSMVKGKNANSVDNSQGGTYTPPMYNDVDSNEKR